MAKAIITIPGKPPKRDRQYTLNLAIFNADDKPADDVVLRFTSRKVLHNGNSQVYLGRLEFGTSVYPLDAVCKLVLGDTRRLRAEATLYTTALKSVQGFLVPHFLDCYTGTSPYSERAVGCILMSYGGKPLRGDWMDIPMEMRSKVIDALVRIHRLGVNHGEFTPQHVVVDSKGHPRIIDFDHAGLHQCGAAKHTFVLYETEPLQTEVNCDEVYDTAVEMDIWTPILCTFMGFTVDMREIKSVNDLVRLARERQPLRRLDDIKKEAYNFLKSYRDHYLLRARKEASRVQESSQASSTNSGSPERPSSISTMPLPLATHREQPHSEVPTESC